MDTERVSERGRESEKTVAHSHRAASWSARASRVRHILTLSLIGAAGVLAVVPSTPAACAAVITKEIATPIAGTVDDPCNGETVEFSGYIHTLGTLTTTPTLLITTFQSNFMQVSGIGQTTGTVYRYHCAVSTTRVEADLILEGPTTTPSISTTRELCIITHNNAILTLLAHYTITPDGTVAVSFDTPKVQCTGRPLPK